MTDDEYRAQWQAELDELEREERYLETIMAEMLPRLDSGLLEVERRLHFARSKAKLLRICIDSAEVPYVPA
jgi:hypothetical protein